jgi:hypothetical protein
MKVLNYTISEGLWEYATGFYFFVYFSCRDEAFFVK